MVLHVCNVDSSVWVSRWVGLVWRWMCKRCMCVEGSVCVCVGGGGGMELETSNRVKR